MFFHLGNSFVFVFLRHQGNHFDIDRIDFTESFYLNVTIPLIFENIYFVQCLTNSWRNSSLSIKKFSSR